MTFYSIRKQCNSQHLQRVILISNRLHNYIISVTHSRTILPVVSNFHSGDVCHLLSFHHRDFSSIDHVHNVVQKRSSLSLSRRVTKPVACYVQLAILLDHVVTSTNVFHNVPAESSIRSFTDDIPFYSSRTHFSHENSRRESTHTVFSNKNNLQNVKVRFLFAIFLNTII